MNHDQMDRPHGRDLRSPHLHAPETGGNGSEPNVPHRVVWMAFGWDMARRPLRSMIRNAEDFGPVRVAGWTSAVADGRIVAMQHDGAELWGRAWRFDECVCASLADRRHPQGVLETVTALDALDRSLEVQLLTVRDPSTSARPALLEAGWAVRGAAETGLPLPWRRHLRTAPFRRGGGVGATSGRHDQDHGDLGRTS